MSDAIENQAGAAPGTSTDAIHKPVKRARRETHTDDVKPQQRPTIHLGDYERGDETIIPIAAGLGMDYVSELAFMEQPIMIRIERSNEKFAPNTVDCWVNGKGAELFVNGKWMVCGWLPVGKPIVTRRKYVEVLLRAKPEAVSTQVIRHNESEDNILNRFTSNKYPLAILQDNDPRGIEWANQIIAEG